MEQGMIPKYKDPREDVETRVRDLLPRMNLEQKVAQLNCLLAVGGAIPDERDMKNGIGQISVLFAGQSARENAACMDQIQR